MTSKSKVTSIGTNGQISLGKEHAGQHVMIELKEPGVWVVRSVRVIPENELPWHDEKARADLEAALRWAQRTPPRESDVEATAKSIEEKAKRNKRSRRSK